MAHSIPTHDDVLARTLTSPTLRACCELGRRFALSNEELLRVMVIAQANLLIELEKRVLGLLSEQGQHGLFIHGTPLAIEQITRIRTTRSPEAQQLEWLAQQGKSKEVLEPEMLPPYEHRSGGIDAGPR